MVSPRSSMEAVANAIANSGKLPSETSLLLHEADTANDDANVELPLLEITPVEVSHIVLNNSDFIGWNTDSNGNRTGRVYFSDYEMTIQLDLWTAKGDGYDPDDLAQRLRGALYPHSSYGPQEPFEDENGNPIDQITYFRIASGERTDDLLQTPTVRRWSQEVELWGHEEFSTDESFIATVDFPSDGDFNDTDDDGTISDT